MPANNRMATGAALKVHGIWQVSHIAPICTLTYPSPAQTTIGDPYAPLGGDDGAAAAANASAYDDFKATWPLHHDNIIMTCYH